MTRTLITSLARASVRPVGDSLPRCAPVSAEVAARRTVLDRFVAQDRRPPSIAGIDFTALSSFHRSALVTDGTLTTLVEAYSLEPTVTRCEAQWAAAGTEPELAWLELAPACRVIGRRVNIEGIETSRLYWSAESFLVDDRLPRSFQDAMACPGASIGQALADSGVENRRELLWYGRRGDAVASRSYRIYVDNAPAIFITEDFREPPTA